MVDPFILGCQVINHLCGSVQRSGAKESCNSIPSERVLKMDNPLRKKKQKLLLCNRIPTEEQDGDQQNKQKKSSEEDPKLIRAAAVIAIWGAGWFDWQLETWMNNG